MKRREAIRAVFFSSAREMFRLAYNVKMQAEESDTAELMLYGEIISDGPEWWKWSKEDKSAAEFKKAIDDVREKGATKLLLRINSPGGICTESVAMRSILGNAGFEEINIRIEGLCASAATDIATLPGAHVAIAEGSEYMIHNPWCLAYGNANQMEHVIERLRGIEQMSRGFYMKRTGKSEEQIREWMDKETWFTARQAVENGFADELLEPEVGAATPAAACVTGREMAVMQSLYQSVPQEITHKEPEGASAGKTGGDKGKPGRIHAETIKTKEDEDMQIDELTAEQLQEQNPDLIAQIRQDAVNAERARLEDIDALTLPGYEEMAAQAKADGTSALDFQKQVVTARKKKGAEFMDSRRTETAPAQQVAGGKPDDNKKTEDQEIQDNAKDMAEYAKQYNAYDVGGMY